MLMTWYSPSLCHTSAQYGVASTRKLADGGNLSNVTQILWEQPSSQRMHKFWHSYIQHYPISACPIASQFASQIVKYSEDFQNFLILIKNCFLKCSGQ